MNGFGTELIYLPSVVSIAFDGTAQGVPWRAIETCLTLRPIKAISFRHTTALSVVLPALRDQAAPAPSVVEEFIYPTCLMVLFPGTRRSSRLRQKRLLAERLCLSSLTLGMEKTARVLQLPLGCAPIQEMAEKDWPSMHTLVLEGELPSSAGRQFCMGLSKILSRMPGLRCLAIRAALPKRTSVGRLRILGDPSPLLPSCASLRSLTITYPDPNDAVFSLRAPQLEKLSIRDWPRHYSIRAEHWYSNYWRSPVLFASEILPGLRRISTPSLASLEFVYIADRVDTDLLHHIVDAYPCLRHLELHRYRHLDEQWVDYEHIVRILAEIRNLTTLRLNLDFGDDPGPYNHDTSLTEPWRRELRERGWHIVDLLNTCSKLEYVQLISHSNTKRMDRILPRRSSNSRNRLLALL
ncbi:hypothetical protein C8Q79DRAFT_915062 [Trametes meyenii]|nr:hypothetical protein C8Q79DRAFT_915062 [Trametes meyenii]